MVYKPYGLSLKPEEKILWIGKRSLKSLLPFLIFGFILTPLYGVGIIFIIYALAVWLRTDYVLTNERVLRIRRYYAFLYLRKYIIEEIKREDVESVYTLQDFMGKTFNYSDVVIEDSKKIVFKGVSEPELVKKLLNIK